MNGACLDAPFCIDFLNGRPPAVQKAREMEGSQTSLSLAVPAAAEVLLWGRRHGEGAWRRTTDLVGRLEVVDATLEVAHEASRLGRECERRGGMVAMMDLLVAATARLQGRALVTRDSDFHRIPGLTIESY